MSAIKSVVLLEEERQQQGLVEAIAQEKTKQLRYQLEAAKAKTLAEGYKAHQSSIHAQVEGTKVGIAYEVLAQNQHQLAAAKHQTGVDRQKTAIAHDALQAAPAERRLKQQLLMESLKNLHMQIESASAANSSALETLKTASGRIPNMKVISVG